MNSSCLKVTVNGKKFLITGLRKEVLRKDLLCALAKTSDETFQQLKQDGGFVAKRRECVSDELTKSTSDENLLTLLKGDRETAGDFESLKILNSLGKNAKIVKRGSENRGQLKDLPPLNPSHHHSKGHRTKDKKHNRSRKKHARELNNDDNKNDNNNHSRTRSEKSSSRSSKRLSGSSSTKTSANSGHTTTNDTDFSSPKHSSTTVVKNKHNNTKTINKTITSALRSVDDSDLDTYKQPKVVNKLRKRQFRRCYDDSDIDIYNSLYDLVLEQNKKLHNTRSESKQLSRRHQSCLVEENLKVYYIDEINNNTTQDINNKNINIKNTTANILNETLCSTTDDYNNTPTTNISISSADNNNKKIVDGDLHTAMDISTTNCFEHKGNADDLDNDNDSGLPSPEYDSSESTDNQPITLQRAMTKLSQQQQQQKQTINISSTTSSTTSHCTTIDGDVDNNKHIITNNLDAAFVKNAFMKCKQNKDFNEKVTTQQQSNILRNENNTYAIDSMCNKNNINTNGVIEENISASSSTSNHCGTLKPSGKLSNYNEDIYLQRRSKSLGDLLAAQGASPMHSEGDVFDITNGITDEIDEEKVRLVLKNLTSDKIINMGVLNPVLMSSTAMKNKKKLEKKKINKADISEPQLLSPTQFRRYGSLKNVQAAAKLLKNGMAGMGRTVALPTGEKEDERKDKEKFYNKKLMEVRRSKRSSKSSKDETKEKLQATDKPPGDNKKSKNVNDRKSKEKDRDKNKKELKSNKQQNELKYNTKHLFKREKSFDTSTSNSTTTTDPNDDTRSCSSSTCRSSSTEPDTTSRYNTNNKKELDIIDIEKQIYELNKLKIQQQKNIETEKYICQPTETSSLIMDDSNLLDSNDDEDNDFHHLHRDPNDDDDLDDEKNGKCSLDDALETTSDYSSLNENIKLESIDDVEDFEHLERNELIALYAQEEEAVNDLIEKIFDYNLLIEALSDEMDILELENDSSETNEDLIAEEENIYSEIDGVRGLLQSVIDLCAYQRKEMSENLALLDKLDTKVRTKKAGYEILRSGEWRTNSNLAPRSLLKYSKEKKTTPNPVPSRNPNSSVV